MNTVRFWHCTVALLIAAAVLLQAAVSHAGGKVAGKQVPWGEEDAVAAATAIDRLQIFLLNALKDERGVHAETLLTAVGALAGFSAQHAIWKTVVAPGKMPIHDEKDHNRGAFIIVKDANGEHYFFGDLLNSYIVPQSKDGIPLGPGPYALWGYLAAPVQAAGKEPTSNSDLSEMFRNTAKTAGGSEFGIPRLPENHRPALAPRDLLNRLWPKTKAILGSNVDPTGREGKSLPIEYWPTVVAVTAQKLVSQTSGSLDPALAMRIVLEAAIPMSKVDPKTVPQDIPASNE